jgi:lipopolysaccharide transport system permease protein
MNYSREDHYIEVNANKLQKQYLKDLVRFRELLFFFAWRDILVRYKEAFFGIAWALIRPLLNMIIFAVVFGKIANLPSGNINYPAFVLAGLLPWQLCSNAIVEGSFSILNNANLINKIYFPRLIIPTAQIAVHFIDFAVGMLFLFIFCLFVQPISPITILCLPLFIVLSLMLCEGGSLWLSALTVKYKDFRFLVPFAVQIGMFISPVGYATGIISDRWIWLYCLNPMVGIIDGFRWAFFGQTYPYFIYSIAMSIVITLFILITGFFYFRKMERSFVDRM